jgi:hypothetical protein
MLRAPAAPSHELSEEEVWAHQPVETEEEDQVDNAPWEQMCWRMDCDAVAGVESMALCVEIELRSGRDLRGGSLRVR